MRVKSLIGAGAVLILAACSSKSPNAYTISGTTDLTDGEWVKLSIVSNNDISTDSVQVANGAFTISGEIETPSQAVLSVGDSNDRGNTKYRKIFLEPGEITTSLTGDDYTKAEVLGSPTTAEADALNAQSDVIQNQMMEIYGKYTQLEDREGEEAQELMAEMNKLQEQRMDLQQEFVATHPDSYYTPYLIAMIGYDWNYDQKKEAYDALTPRVQAAATSLKEELDILSTIQPGMPAPDLSGTTPAGEEVALSDLKGNVVLLDFWATWCGPCRRSMPHVRQVAEQYGDKGLQVFMCSIDAVENADKWKEVIESDGLANFTNILSGLSSGEDGKRDKSNDQSTKYNIKYIPQKYLIDAEGNIIGKFDDEAELDAKLAEIFS